MKPASDAIVTREASIEIGAGPEAVYALVTSIDRMGEWSPEAVGGTWLDGGSATAGSRFDGHNRSGDREWSRECEVVVADEGRDFTFVVGGVAANRTWWSYELNAIPTGTELTERWWIVNKSPAMAEISEEQFAARADFTQTMLDQTLAALKKTAESGR